MILELYILGMACYGSLKLGLDIGTKLRRKIK